MKFFPNCRLPDDHVINLNHEYLGEEWNLENSILSWDLVNFIINDLSHFALKNWLQNCSEFSNLQDPITISAMVESPLESSKRFILQRYLAPGKKMLKLVKCYQIIIVFLAFSAIFAGFTPKIKRNDFMTICNGASNSLWWNQVDGGCPSTSDKKWCFLKLTDLEKAYKTEFEENCFFSNRFSLGAHPTSAICHSIKIWESN